MINVDLKLASDSKVFLTPLPPPLLAMADFSKPAWVAIILEPDQWMKRQERAEQQKQAPNDARSVVWALGEFFFFFSIFSYILAY